MRRGKCRVMEPRPDFMDRVLAGIGLSAVGIAVGIGGAIALTRTLEGILFGVSATDRTTLAAVAVLFGCVSWIASIVPAHRATRVDPMVYVVLSSSNHVQ